jgi:hypothetical protein
MERRDILRFALVGAIALGATALGVVLRGMRGPRMAKSQDAPGVPRSETRSVLDPKDPAGLGPHLRKKFDYLSIDDAVIEAYVRDRADGNRRLDLSKEYPRFLLSTDFFQNGADESRPLAYMSLFDAYVSPCYQPLARLVNT